MTEPYAALASISPDERGNRRLVWGDYEFIVGELGDAPEDIALFNDTVRSYAEALPGIISAIVELYPPDWEVTEERVRAELGAPKVHLRPTAPKDIREWYGDITLTYLEHEFDYSHIIDVSCSGSVRTILNVSMDG
ncbi:MAG: hypothetical protein Q4D85_11075 [Corynebacterium sp.]|uniref:hypothetical protein n=1 Tax=Corynebacterium sp. TaxID=1720 RepID=UPI0026DBF145|nr:hypothetical protein [Corynebacterium sp.]MDO5099276.1 hypothetical protein [Corynebacterium sp.]